MKQLRRTYPKWAYKLKLPSIENRSKHYNNGLENGNQIGEDK